MGPEEQVLYNLIVQPHVAHLEVEHKLALGKYIVWMEQFLWHCLHTVFSKERYVVFFSIDFHVWSQTKNEGENGHDLKTFLLHNEILIFKSSLI